MEDPKFKGISSTLKYNAEQRIDNPIISNPDRTYGFSGSVRSMLVQSPQSIGELTVTFHFLGETRVTNEQIELIKRGLIGKSARVSDPIEVRDAVRGVESSIAVTFNNVGKERHSITDALNAIRGAFNERGQFEGGDGIVLRGRAY